MSLLVILIFTMTSRIVAGEYATLNDSVSTNADSKRPHIMLQFNFSKDNNYTPEIFSKYDVNATINKLKNILNRTKVIKPTFVVTSTQFPVTRTQTRRADDAMKTWRRKRRRKLLRTFSKHILNDIALPWEKVSRLKDVKLGQSLNEFSEEEPSRMSNGRMEALFFKERILNPKESDLNSFKTFHPIKPKIPKKLRNAISSRQLLQQHEDSFRKVLTNRLKISNRGSVYPKMLQAVAYEVQSMNAEFFTKCRISKSHKSFRHYSECHDGLRAILNRISEHKTLKQNNTITLARLLSRSKRHAKQWSFKAPRKADDDKGKSTLDKPMSREKAIPAKRTDVKTLKEDGTTVDPFEKQIDFMQHLESFVLKDLKNVKDEEQAKTGKRLDEKRKQFKTDIAKAEEVKTTSSTVPRDLNGTDVDDPKPNRFSSVEVVPPEPESIIFIFRRTTSKEPCQKDDALYALVMAFGICFGILLFGICIVVCLIDDAPKWSDRQPLIIYRRTKRPTTGGTAIIEESVQRIDRLPRRRWSYDDIGEQHNRRERRHARRLARRSRYTHLHAATTWPVHPQTRHSLQPVHIISKSTGGIELPTATPVAQLGVDMKRPESPAPRSERGTRPPLSQSPKTETQGKMQIAASSTSATPPIENIGPPISQEPKTESPSKMQVAGSSRPTSATPPIENTVPPMSQSSKTESPSRMHVASTSATPPIENTGPPMSQSPKTESQSRMQVAVSSTSATQPIENTGPPMSIAPKTESQSKVHVSTSSIPLYENTEPPKSSMSENRSQIPLTTSTSATPLDANTSRPEPPVPKSKSVRNMMPLSSTSSSPLHANTRPQRSPTPTSKSQSKLNSQSSTSATPSYIN